MGRIYDATWGRAFSALYDRGLKATEEAGLREMRREAAIRGERADDRYRRRHGGQPRVCSRAAVTELVLAEPDPHMLQAAAAQTGASRAGRPVVQAPAEQLPFEDDSFDTAVFTLVLCTVPDPRAALAEAARVLKPGGRLLFIEHVRAEDPGLARWQDRLERPWRFLGDGCHCNRDTVATIEASPFELERVERGSCPRRRRSSEPLVRGVATLPRRAP